VAIRRLALSQALVRSIGQRWRAWGVAGLELAAFAAPDLARGRPGRDRLPGAAAFADPRLDPAGAQLLGECG
jgi:hypothetical protein